MGNFIKDLGVLLFTAGEEIEGKAEEFKKMREERYSEFEDKIKDKKDELKSKIETEINKAKGNWTDLTDKLGFASKNEIKELKDKIDELSAKLDKLGK